MSKGRGRKHLRQARALERERGREDKQDCYCGKGPKQHKFTARKGNWQDHSYAPFY